MIAVTATWLTDPMLIPVVGWGIVVGAGIWAGRVIVKGK